MNLATMEEASAAGPIRCWLACLLSTMLGALAVAPAGAAPIAWAVGAGGTIVVSTDFGATWAPQASGATSNLRGIDFLDPLHGVAVGDGGTLLRTLDGGSTWSARASGVTTALWDVVLSSPSKGVALGDDGNGAITLDGGASWIPIVFPSSPDFRALAMTIASTIVAVGNDRAWSRSTDGGITWAATGVTTSGSPAPPLNWLGASGFGAGQAIAVGGDQNGGMYTLYSGTSWSPPVYIGSFAPTPTPLGFQLLDVDFTGSTLVAVGAGGVVTRSTDGGTTWTAPTSVTGFDLFDVEFFDAMNGLAVGAGGKAIRTSDGGVTWSTPIDAAGVNLYALALMDVQPGTVPEPGSLWLVVLTAAAMMVVALRARADGHAPARLDGCR